MEVQSSDSKKLFKVFDASKHKRCRKKQDDGNSVATDESISAYQGNVDCIISNKASQQDFSLDIVEGLPIAESTAREKRSKSSIHREGHRSPRRHKRHSERDNSPSEAHEEQRSRRDHRSREGHRSHDGHRSPRHHRRSRREGLSLALRDGIASPSRSNSPVLQDVDACTEPTQDSFIYEFLEDAIKRDKKRNRHSRRHDERSRHRDRRGSRERDREQEREREHEHRHRRHRDRDDDVPSRDTDTTPKEVPAAPPAPTAVIDQAALLETFAKICAQMNDNKPSVTPAQRTQSHKSLQCEVVSRRDLITEHRTERPLIERSREDLTPTNIRSQENCRQSYTREKPDPNQTSDYYYEKAPPYDKEFDRRPYGKEFHRESKYDVKNDYKGYSKVDLNSKVDLHRSRVVIPRNQDDDKYNYPPQNVRTRTCILYPCTERRDGRDSDYRNYGRRNSEENRRRYIEQKTSRSFDTHRDGYEDERCKRTSRTDPKDKRYDDKYYRKPTEGADRYPVKDRRPRERFERNSVASREEYRERESERERDSGLSAADGETSTISGRTGRSTYLRVVKQEIAEQRESMDKMMNLWKDLMRCFKGISKTQDKDKTFNENACEDVRQSAAAQLRLWRECMRRYETVARDVGDTDARLMEEITKQRSEMSEMASMWQECLQRYRDMSNDFNNLKKQLTTAESPSRATGGGPHAEGETAAPHYPAPNTYPQVPQLPAQLAGAPYVPPGSPLRGRASAPPAWWWGAEQPSPRRRSSRRSSPDSRSSRDRKREGERKHRHKDVRDASRYKEKSSKPSAARSDHRRRKR